VAELAWRRTHEADIVAEVIPAADAVWSAAAWLQSNPIVIVRTERRMESRESACAKADALARLMTCFECRVDVRLMRNAARSRRTSQKER